MVDGREKAASLVRSKVRVELLRRLREGTATRYELRDALDCSRTTVDRNLDHLAEAGWVRRIEEGYAITTSGTFALETALEFVETVGVAARLEPILRWIPRSEFDVDLRHLSGAEMTLPGEATPHAALDRHTAAIEGCSRFRGILPVTSAQQFERQYDRTRSGEMATEFVVPPTVADVFLTDPRFADMTAELRDLDTFSVYVTDEGIPYYLGVVDETVQIGVGKDGRPRGLLETDSETVREWAHRTIDEYRESAVPLDRWERDQECTDGRTG